MKLRASRIPMRMVAARMTAHFGIEFTTNACIGRAMRLRLPKINKEPKVKARAARENRSPWRQAHKGHNSGPRLEGAPMPSPSEFDVARLPGKTFQQLRDHHCRFILTEDTPFLFCAEKTVPGKPWCVHHLRRVFPNVKPELKIIGNEPVNKVTEPATATLEPVA